MEEQNKPKYIDLQKIATKLWQSKKLLLKVWVITFILSCVWILPKPRYYVCELKLAPEMSGEEMGGGLSSLASSFGFNLGGMAGQDAIYPELYPELFESPQFLVGLYAVQVSTKDGELNTDYFTYMKNHQKKNFLTWPFRKVMIMLKELTEDEDATPRGNGASDINPFQMNKKDYELMELIRDMITCSVDKKTSVITIHVRDQDPLICATMADSVRLHLQDFIIRYRTSKASEDVAHYQQMRDSASLQYDEAMVAYSRFCDSHQNIIMQSFQSEREKLENELSLRQNTLTAMETQLQTTKVKLQEKTPAFTLLKSATVPVKPAGPKRMFFVAAMLFLSTLVTIVVTCREYLIEFL